MATYSKILLSGSTNGKGIKIAGTAIGSATTIHTAVSGTTDYDLVTLYAVNSDTVSRKFTVAFGGTTDPDNAIELTLPAESGLIPIILGDIPLQNGLVIGGFASVTNVVVVYGSVVRIDN